jgi:RHS repeat-associated protein
MGSWKKFCSRRGTAFIDSRQALDASRKNGRLYDATASGQLIYNYFRNYDPTLGRYVESDPIGLRGGMNTYAYVGSRPLRYEDRSGLLESPLGDAAADGLKDWGKEKIGGGALAAKCIADHCQPGKGPREFSLALGDCTSIWQKAVQSSPAFAAAAAQIGGMAVGDIVGECAQLCSEATEKCHKLGFGCPTNVLSLSGD